MAWAMHENLGDHTAAALAWLESCGKGEGLGEVSAVRRMAQLGGSEARVHLRMGWGWVCPLTRARACRPPSFHSPLCSQFR